MMFELGIVGAERFQRVTGLRVDMVTLRCLLDTEWNVGLAAGRMPPDVRGEVRAADEDELLPGGRNEGRAVGSGSLQGPPEWASGLRAQDQCSSDIRVRVESNCAAF